MKNKSVFDLDENLVAALSYVFGPFSGIFVLVMEKGNKFVRFHALQSTLWFLMLMIIGWILSIVGSVFSVIPVIRIFTGGIIGLAMTVGSLIYFGSKIFLFLKAYSGKTFKMPILGDVAWAQVNK